MPTVSPEITPDPRRATRFTVDFETICEFQPEQEMQVHIANISAHGMMLTDPIDMEK